MYPSMTEMLVASENHPPMSADLLRQRRNLLVTSLTLTAIDLAGATLKKDVSVLGASLEFTNPERVVWGLWILWSYFLVRYWQYLNVEPDLGIHEGMRRWISQRISWDEFDVEYRHWLHWKYWILWSVKKQRKEWDSEHWTDSERDPSSKMLKAAWTLRSFLSVATTTPRVTDFFIPFIVAAIPVLLAASSLISAKFP